MYKWTAFPFIRLAICLAAGIVCQQKHPALWTSFPIAAPLIIGITIIVISRVMNSPVFKGFALLLFTFWVGGLLSQLSNDASKPRHYVHTPRVDGFVGIIVSDNTERDNHHRYEMELQLLQLNDSSFHTEGKIYFYVSKKSAPESNYKYGDVLIVNRGYFPVAPPKNPHEFNYQAYLKKHNIYSHAFVDSENILKVDNQPPNSILQWAFGVRSKAKQLINSNINEDREKAILTALLLGIKDYLDDETQTAYASAGAMHVLAVSGLHVGIVILIISTLFGKWRETKLGTFIYTLSTVTIIWIYALVTGFSPSVMRAATMFTVILISSGISKRANIYNSLGIAAIVLITYNPFIIYAVGFQLSFAAVFGIVLLQPRLYRLYEFNSKTADYIWSITCVSVAAQVATFPLSMLYFHQFPTYFLISNLIVIPSAFLMLGGGLAMLIGGSLIPIIGTWIGIFLEWFTKEINDIILALQHLPYPIFDWLYFDLWDTILVYLLLLLIMLTFVKYSYDLAVISCLISLALICWLHWKTFEQIDQQKLIFYEIDDVVAIDLISQNQAQLLVDDRSMGGTKVVSFQIDPNRLANGLPKSSASWNSFEASELVTNHEHFDLLQWRGVRIALLKEMKNWDFSDSIKADIVYFKHHEDINYMLSRTTQVILGTGFNYYENRRAKQQFQERNIAVHSLTQDGYWELDLNQ